jgi:transcriptional regulator with XRE-family HTH domain
MRQKQIYHPGYRALVARLKVARLEAGLSQEDVARQLGVCRTWVTKVETNELGLDLLGLVKLCRVYGLRAGELILLVEE